VNAVAGTRGIKAIVVPARRTNQTKSLFSPRTLIRLDDPHIMEHLESWRICDELSIQQAACLLNGILPITGKGTNSILPLFHTNLDEVINEERASEAYFRRFREVESSVLAVITALSVALRGGRIPGTARWIKKSNWDSISEIQVEEETDEIDPEESTIMVNDLEHWLSKRGIRNDFFFSKKEQSVDYLDRSHPRYSSKLAATVNAWKAVDDVCGKSPKEQLTIWLTEHAKEFDLYTQEGAINKQGIEECAKVANWKPIGGAPKTPG
jgi:hypothetical protein